MPGSQLKERPHDSEPTGPPAAESEALRAYNARMSRLRVRYGAAIAVVVVLALVGGWLRWRTGEAHDATLRTATSPEPAVADEPLATTLDVAWTSANATATGSYVSRGTVVTYSAHSVRGRDALTGDVRWSCT